MHKIPTGSTACCSLRSLHAFLTLCVTLPLHLHYMYFTLELSFVTKSKMWNGLRLLNCNEWPMSTFSLISGSQCTSDVCCSQCCWQCRCVWVSGRLPPAPLPHQHPLPHHQSHQGHTPHEGQMNFLTSAKHMTWQRMQSMKSADLIDHSKFLPWRQLNGCSVTRPFPSLWRVWLAGLVLPS